MHCRCLLLALVASRLSAQEPDAWYRTFTQAVAKGDTAAVHRMTTPDYTFVSFGRAYTQAERLVDIASVHDEPGASITPACTWHRHGSAVIGVCHVVQRIPAHNGEAATEGSDLVLVTLVKEGADWRMAANSVAPEPPDTR
jgi:hypothetical protein